MLRKHRMVVTPHDASIGYATATCDWARDTKDHARILPPPHLPLPWPPPRHASPRRSLHSSLGARRSRSRRLNKHALVLVHGFGGNSKWQWNRQIGALSRSFDLYIPDLVFFGSSRSAGPDPSVGFQSSCVAEAMRRLGVARYSVVGISYSGFVAFRMAEGPAAGAVQRVAILASGICATPEQLRDLTAKEGRDVGELLLPQKAEDLMTLIRRSMYRHPQRIPPPSGSKISSRSIPNDEAGNAEKVEKVWIIFARSPCALVRPRSSRHRGGARLDGRNPRVRLGRSAAGVVELGSGISVSARVGRRILQEGRVGWGSRRDLSDGQVSLVVDFAIPLLRRGAWAFIVTITGRSYLRPLSSSLLTMSPHLTMPSVVLAARRAPSSLQLGDVDLAHLTLVRSVLLQCGEEGTRTRGTWQLARQRIKSFCRTPCQILSVLEHKTFLCCLIDRNLGEMASLASASAGDWWFGETY
ncbi:hypothetical protein GW17_00025652 [Ensete ventricosum]|nr:hypothetical protein GW17_00025652 [Ensete ventricosum]